MNLYMSPIADRVSEHVDAMRAVNEERNRRRSEEAFLLAQRLVREAMYAGVYGRPFPQEIENMRGNYPIFRTYYDAGAAIARRVELTEQAFAAKRPDNGKTFPTHG